MFNQKPEFAHLLQAMCQLTYVPTDARQQFDAMLRQHFIGSIDDDDICPYCEAPPGDNDHCAGDTRAHAWHICGDPTRTAFIDSKCPQAVSA